MSVPSSVEELLQLIRKSGMIEDQKLTAYLQRRQAGRGLPPDPRDAADSMVKDGLITNFQAEQFLLGKWRGFTIGKYKLLERVGVGGMGQVFLCEHMYMKRRVAIKVLPPAKAEQPAALGRFYREARAAGSLEHVNIVRTHDIDQDGNLHFIVMEYVDGSNLLDMVKKAGPMDIGRASHYIRQVALGLDFAFRSGIIHRDIKPGNVLVDRKGVAKILDMGLARFYKDQTDMLTVKYDDKIVLGTADYVAPEQVANSHQVDIRADIYAMGASFYFLLAGHPAFPTGTVSQKLLWHRTKDPTPIRQIRPEVPEGIAAIVSKMLAKDPNLRYQTPMEVANDLEKWIPADIPVPTLEEMPQLSIAALEEEPSGEQSFIVPETASQSQLIESVASKPAQRPQAANPFSAPVQGPKSFVGTQSAGTAVAPPPSKREPSLTGPKTSRLQPLSQLSPPKRAEATFPPNPFAPALNSDIQTLTAVDPSTTPADPDENYFRPQPTNQQDQSSFVTNVFGNNGKTKMMVFVVLVTMCLTLGVGLLGMKLLKSPSPKPSTSEAK